MYIATPVLMQESGVGEAANDGSERRNPTLLPSQNTDTKEKGEKNHGRIERLPVLGRRGCKAG
jgi:hypothetical protein